MSVAPSFESLEKILPPFTENGKEYIYVICKNGNKRKVRWYSEQKKKETTKVASKNTSLVEGNRFNAHDAFFFGDKNFITLYDGDEEEIQKWRNELPQFSILRNTYFGFYSPSYFTMTPPAGIRAMKLDWSEISKDNSPTEMKDKELVLKCVNEKFYGESKSEFQGEKDEWLVKTVTIKSNTIVETHFSENHFHVMEDDNGNQYVWSTAAKDLQVGRAYLIKMKVKEHQVYRGINQTVVYYCKIIKEV